MKSRVSGWILEAFFTVVYFWCLFQVVDFLLIGTAIAVANVLAIPGLFLALIVSIGLAEFTVKKIKEHL